MLDCDKRRLEALKYVVENKNGFLTELQEQIGQEYVDEFSSLGFIHLGYTLTYATWGVTDSCKRYYKVVK